MGERVALVGLLAWYRRVLAETLGSAGRSLLIAARSLVDWRRGSSVVLLAGLAGLLACSAADDGPQSEPEGAAAAAIEEGVDGSWWRPAPGTSWQWQLTGDLDTSLDVAMYDLDLFRLEASDVEALQADGRVVTCYFSAGTREDWRDDADGFAAEAIGEPLEDWPDESWLDVRHESVRHMAEVRLDAALALGCDAVEPDNVDAYENDSGFPLTEADQLDFVLFLATEAHGRGLSVGLKNALGLVEAALPHFDWALNEECHIYEECSELQPFITADKAVFHVEYVDDISDQAAVDALLASTCADPATAGFSTLVKGWDLEAFRATCPADP